MTLVQILLPLYGPDGSRQPPALFAQVKQELVDRFGGVTAYSRAPAEGLWEEDGKHVVRDDILVCEVMVDPLDRDWWRDYRVSLEQRFRQQALVVRAWPIEVL